MLQVEGLRVNYLTEAVGIPANPHFSWKLKSDARGVTQSAFQFQLSEDVDFGRVLFDSGEVASGESAHYTPDRLPLDSARRYHWRVRVRAGDGPWSGYAVPSTFVTALLRQQDWQARFVSAERPSDAGSSKGSRIGTSFQVEGPVRAAYVFSTALGLYHLYLNGEKVGEDQLAPGWTSYHKRLLYQTYDITAQLKPGGNDIAARLGAGWYKGKMGFLLKRNNYGPQTALLCQIMIEYEDGRRVCVATDTHWHGGASPVVFSEIYDGETYDARIKSGVGCPVEVVDFDLATLHPQAGCRMRVHERLAPARIFTTPGGDRVIDFGQNLTGFVAFEVDGEPGDVVELTCFETLDKDGNVYTANLRSAKQAIHYTARGGGVERYQPLHTFQGFRYVWVRAYPGALRAERFAALVVHSQMEPTGSFACSNPDINRLQHNILWSMKGNFVDVPTDCPQRDERMGWTGDAQMFCPTAAYLMGVYPFFAKWLDDVMADQTAEGGIPHVVPDIVTGQPEVAGDWLLSQGTHSASAWADAIVLCPWNLYLAYGDTGILRACYDSMKAWIDFMRRHATGVLWNYKLQLGDWVALDAAEGSYFGATPNDLSCTAYYAYSTGIFARIAGILGNTADQAAYAALHETIVAGFQALFFDSRGDMTVQTQTAHILALRFGLVTDALRERTVQGLLRLLEKENYHLVTGFMGTPYFTHVLSDHGHTDAAYRLLLQDDFPSWLYQVRCGATTIWEHWDGIRPDGSMWSPDMNSFNHYAYGAIGNWLYTHVAGIRPDERQPGYRGAVIHPRVGGGLAHASGALETVYGRVSVAWCDQGETVSVTIEIPPNASADVCLDGSAIIAADGLAFQSAPGRLTAHALSGTYRLTYQK